MKEKLFELNSGALIRRRCWSAGLAAWFSDSFAVYSAQGGKESAAFGLGCADACDPVVVYLIGGVNFNGLQILKRSARNRTVERTLQSVPRKLVGHAHVFVINKDAPAIIIAANQIDNRPPCCFLIH